MRTFVVGDIHGCFDELMELTKQMDLQHEDMLISLGDVVDRGNKSKEVYEYFANRPNSKVLIGNHERKHQNTILSYAQEIVKVQFGEGYTDFLKWVDTLEYYHETEDAIIVHAFFEHDVALKDQRQDVLSGSTSGERYLEKKYTPNTYWNEYYTGTKPIIYGHHVVGDEPKIMHNTFGIDTGCCHGQYLTAIELPGFTIHQVKAKKDYWKEEQRLWQIPVLKAKNWSGMDFDTIEKQLEKLAYIEEPQTVLYLSELKTWKNDLQNNYAIIKAGIDKLCDHLMETHGESFSVEANKYPFKTYLFKSKNNSLTIDDLRKGLNTPAKVQEITRRLEME